jgi:hypothetical protein
VVQVIVPMGSEVGEDWIGSVKRGLVSAIFADLIGAYLIQALKTLTC